MVKYYHYTTAEAAVAILKSNTLILSTANHAVFGNGVYFTSFSPMVLEAAQIYQNNWGYPMSPAMTELPRMCACFEIEYGGDKMVRAPHVRDVWLFRDEHMEDLVRRVTRVYILLDLALAGVRTHPLIVNLGDRLVWCELKNGLFAPLPIKKAPGQAQDKEKDEPAVVRAPPKARPSPAAVAAVSPASPQAPVTIVHQHITNVTVVTPPPSPATAPTVPTTASPAPSPAPAPVAAPSPAPAPAPVVLTSLLSGLPDARITASSMWGDRADHGPTRSRLHLQIGMASAWCAKVCDASQWIQADLGDPNACVHRVLTQGRADMAQWVCSYRIGVSHDGVSFAYLPQVYTANSDQNTVVTNEINPPLRGRFVRLQPVTWREYLSLRWDLVGVADATVARSAVPVAPPPVATPPQASPPPAAKPPKYHGDPSRSNKFWVYPRMRGLVTPAWDCYNAADLCNNHKFLTNQHGGLKEYQCLGHPQ